MSPRAKDEELLLDLDGPRPGLPVLVSGISATAVMDGSAEFTLQRETRGADAEWGGVYGQEVRLTGPWWIRWSVDGTPVTLSKSLTRLRSWRWGVESLHSSPGLAVAQEVAALPVGPGITRRLVFTNRQPAPITVRLESEMVPHLAPVILEGVKPYDYSVATRKASVYVRAHTSAMTIDCDPFPRHLSLNQAPWIGGRWVGELQRLRFDHELEIGPGESIPVRWIIVGGTERTVGELSHLGQDELDRSSEWLSTAKDEWHWWQSNTPRLSFPNAPELERGYELARGALRSLYKIADTGIIGLVAGFPWYAAIWCRDLAWMLPAVLWLGDLEWTKASVETVLRFQAPRRISVLSAQAGEIPMQISAGPIFVYGTSDTTLYYPTVARRYFDHSGDLETIRSWLPSLLKVVEWAQTKTNPQTRLVMNGDEIRGTTRASQMLGMVHYGFDAVDTTIWDSADRRDHAIDIQVLWCEALRSLANLSEELQDSPAAEGFRRDAHATAETIRERYPWPEEGYLFDSLRRDGQPVRKLRPNAVLAVGKDILLPEYERTVVRRIYQDDLTTRWGVRTLSDRDSQYDPTAYHEGQVWTIADAWAACAALRVGDRSKGIEYLLVNARHLIEEHGLANECYRGDRPEPFNSCFLLGFSVAPFLTVLFEDLWGISPNAARNEVRIAPRFPAHWTEASLEGLRIGDGRLSLKWQPGRIQALWEGSTPLSLLGENSAVTLHPSVAGELNPIENP